MVPAAPTTTTPVTPPADDGVRTRGCACTAPQLEPGALRGTALPHAITGADGLSDALKKLHSNAHLLRTRRQLDEIDARSDALNVRVHRATAQARRVLAENERRHAAAGRVDG